jgi:glucosamine--fructose-6-phosphate aminotransferase (isomerizing)
MTHRGQEAAAPVLPSAMAREIRATPSLVARQLDRNASGLATIVAAIGRLDPRLLVTIGRGSSDHAALYLKYIVEILLGLPCCTIGPSIASVYGTPLRLAGALAVTISQSGRSPDIVTLQRAARAGGAATLALVNVLDSPVAAEAQWVLPLQVGPEQAVAATKTMIASLVAGLSIVAAWSGQTALQEALAALPALLAEPVLRSADLPAWLAGISSCYVLGRGATYPIAAEAALKLKETAAIHAEAFSAAEVLHGPAALVGPDFPILAFMAQDEAREAMQATLTRLQAIGARLIVFDAAPPRPDLVAIPKAHPLVAPILMLQGFYALAEETARRRGRNPDLPDHLSKVTETI